MEPQALTTQYLDSSFTYKLTIPAPLFTINANKTPSTETKDQAHMHLRPLQTKNQVAQETSCTLSSLLQSYTPEKQRQKHSPGKQHHHRELHFCKVSVCFSIMRGQQGVKRGNMALFCCVYSYFLFNVHFEWCVHSSRR